VGDCGIFLGMKSAILSKKRNAKSEGNMFRGVNAINIDAKGRIIMPTRYRESLKGDNGHIVITIDTEERCLLLYPFTAWEAIENKLTALPSFNSKARRIQRLLIGHATECELDKSGRILLPHLLREYAGLTKIAVLVGQGQKFELWDDALWQARREEWLSEESLLDDAQLPDELKSLSL